MTYLNVLYSLSLYSSISKVFINVLTAISLCLLSTPFNLANSLSVCSTVRYSNIASDCGQYPMRLHICNCYQSKATESCVVILILDTAVATDYTRKRIEML